PFLVRLNWDFGESSRGPGTGGHIDFVPAGRQDSLYLERVNSFDWRNLFDPLGRRVVLEGTKEFLRLQHDYVLIDSRTGVSDTSGICTVQLPHVLVALFTANNQSIEGCANVMESVRARRIQSVKGSGSELRILPVLTRVELSETDKLERRKSLAR